MMDYSNTLNLPKTSFSMKANLVDKEPDILKKWDELNIYSLIRKSSKGKKKYILHDGPPYANGNIHMGHALNKILKDIIIKYKSLCGCDSPYVPGWDCHGLPIEFQLLKKLKISKKETIERVAFRKKCREYALHFVDVQREEFKRLGIFGSWDKPYLTLNNEYEAAIIGVFKELVRQGYIYRSLKPIYWCASCETALADAEVEYAEHTSPSVYVEFPVIGRKSLSIIIWTTTPWTLPANVALAFHPDYEYAYVKINKDKTWIMAKELVARLMEKFNITEYTITETRKGKELEGIQCQHPFMDRTSKGILGNFITLDDGTGVVHIAPGHGVEDYQAGLEYDLPILSPVDDRGVFTSEAGEFSGTYVFKANSLIIERLLKDGFLIYTEDISHSYPNCWRCKKPVIFRATKQWFMEVDKHDLRKKMCNIIDDVQWIPGYGKQRIAGMLQSRPDWCLSRQRYWGVPLPIFYCNKCKKPLLDIDSIEAVRKLISKEGSDSWFIKDVQDILPVYTKCPDCGGSDFSKETDIIDVWFDSGVSHEAVLKVNTELSWPSDLYLEGSDQHRGWFQTSLITSVALYSRAPYKTVLTHGFLLDAKGKAMHKSHGNAISPQEITKKFGADILRLWVSSEDYRSDVRLGDEILMHLVEAYRRIRNTCRFLLGNLGDFDVAEDAVGYDKLLEIDKWALHRLQVLIKEVRSSYENFEFHRVYRLLYDFCNIEMSSFYLDILKDRLYTSGKKSAKRRAAQSVLYEVLKSVTIMIAPILSFTAEEVWSYIPSNNKESVFLASFPEVNTMYIDDELNERWERILTVRSGVSKVIEMARNEKLVGNSLQACVEMYVDTDSKDGKELYDFLSEYASQWPMIFIVSQVELFNKGISKKSFSSTEIDNLYVRVIQATGQKCMRCWNWSESVGKDSIYPEICDKCIKETQEDGR